MSDLPPGWEWSTLGGLAASEERAITDGPFGSNLKSAHYTAEGARVFRLQNIGDGVFRDELAYVSIEHFERLRAHEAIEGDLLIASLGDTHPRACLVPRMQTPAIVKADCIRVRFSPHVDARWVLYSLLSPTTRTSTTALIKGVGRPRLGLAQIRSIPVPLPPLGEQRRIVADLEGHLSNLDAAEEHLTSAVGRISPLRSRSTEVLLKGLQPLRPLASLIREPLRNGYSGRMTRAAGGTRTLTLTAVTKGEFVDANTKIADTFGRRIDDLWLKAGDILVQRSNTPDLVGTSALYTGPDQWAIFPDLLIRVRVGPELLPEFAQLVLSSSRVREELKKAAKGLAGSMPKIDQGALLKVLVPVPEISAQRLVVDRAASLANDLQRVAGALDVARRRGKVLRRSLLADAFAGRLVPQDPTDEPASVLLERIRAERASAPKPKRARRGPRTDPAQETLS